MKPCNRLLFPLLAAVVGAGFAMPSHAGGPNLIVVTTTADDTNGFDQKCSLREAVANANTNTQSSPVVDECVAGSSMVTDEIVLQSGATYALTLADAPSGDLDLLLDPDLPSGMRDLRIVASEQGMTATISQTVSNERVVEVQGASVTLRDVTLRGGAIDGGGGGLYNNQGGVTLQRVSIVDNSANSGGGFYNDGDASVQDSEFLLNSASLLGGGIFHAGGTLSLHASMVRANEAATGGGIYSEGSLNVMTGSAVNLNTASGDGGGVSSTGAGDVNAVGALFEGNTSGGLGGGVYAGPGTSFSSEDSDFIGNSAVDGGGVRVFSIEPATILGGRVADNDASLDGGGIYVSHLAMSGTVIEDNSAANFGGGVHVAGNGEVSDTTVQRNLAAYGGGIYARDLVLRDSAIRDNSATQQGGGAHVYSHVESFGARFVDNSAFVEGGGLWLAGEGDSFITRTLFEGNQALVDGGGVWTSATMLAIANSTLSGNGAPTGAGGAFYILELANVYAYNITMAVNGPSETIAKFGDLTLQNSIVSSSVGLDCVAALDNPGILSFGHNLASDNSCVGLDAVGDQVDIDPLLAALANNGGNTRTHALLPGSPAIDSADTDACNGKLTAGVDQRGAPRPELVGCDIGAHEQAVELPEIFVDGFED